jgi:hypothetical protein
VSAGCKCASAIDHEMAAWVALGGGNSGCCGNVKHVYGFHLPANALPVTDYSRAHEPGRPVDMSWACAGDFHHGRNPRLLAMHATVLTRLTRGELPMICEFIGQPFPNEPVLYWARWNGITTVRKYTGSGHDMWSHISWWRSQANQPAGLWTPATGSTTAPAPAAPGKLVVDGKLGPATISRWQQIMGTPRDGVISPRRSALVEAVQRRLNAGGARLVVDGDGIRQDGRRYLTAAALQRHLVTPADGRLSDPRSMAVQALQRRLNAGTF